MHVQGVWRRGRWEGPHLHGDVCDGGGRQVKVLLDQDVELGGQVAAGPNAVHLAGQQGGHLRHEGGTGEN